jgi:hypothetical protein
VAPSPPRPLEKGFQDFNSFDFRSPWTALARAIAHPLLPFVENVAVKPAVEPVSLASRAQDAPARRFA